MPCTAGTPDGPELWAALLRSRARRGWRGADKISPRLQPSRDVLGRAAGGQR
ncbi:hypothetical protein Nmel_015359 [Mimus melanotis]